MVIDATEDYSREPVAVELGENEITVKLVPKTALQLGDFYDPVLDGVSPFCPVNVAIALNKDFH